MFLKRVISSITTVALCASFMVPAVTFADAAFTGGTDISGGLNVQVSITDLQVTGAAPGDTIPVFLYVPAGSLSMTTTTGLTFTGSSSGQRLYFSGTLTDINTALATLKYTHSSAGTYTLEASIIGSGQIYDPSTQHMYEVVNNGSSITATAARSAATARSINGVSGYLANITSSDENSFVAARITQDGWFGASDAGVEGDWVWLDGPETGLVFWRGTAIGTAFGYENWAGSEPNQSGDEDCSEFYANGSGWNDLPCSHSRISTYIVEYGAPGNLPNVASDTLDITLSADTVTQTPVLTSPTTSSLQNTLQLTYSLPEVPLAGSVTVGLNNGTTTTILTMSDNQTVNTTVNLSDLDATDGVTSANASSLADGRYTVSLNYQDYLGNAVSSDIETLVTIDTTVDAPVIDDPLYNATLHSDTTTIEGDCEAGATVSVTSSRFESSPITGTCSNDGRYIIEVQMIKDTTPSISLSVSQTDMAGNESEETDYMVQYLPNRGGGWKATGAPTEQKQETEKNIPTPEKSSTPSDESVVLNAAEETSESKEEEIKNIQNLSNTTSNHTATCSTVYPTNYIKLGRNNDVEQVKLLEEFLNTYEKESLEVNGIYEQKDFEAVIRWQEKYSNDILKPWGIKKGTGYVYKKSLAKIKEIVDKNCPKEPQKIETQEAVAVPRKEEN